MPDPAFNAVGAALSDVGRNIGGILSDEAVRRQQALSAQQEQNRLSLSQQQLALQGRREELTGQLGLAKAQEEGRQFDVLRQEHEADRAQQTVQQMRQAGIQERGIATHEDQLAFMRDQAERKQRELELADPLVDLDQWGGAVAGHVEATQGPGTGQAAVQRGMGILQTLAPGLADSIPVNPATGKRQVRLSELRQWTEMAMRYRKDPENLSAKDVADLTRRGVEDMMKDPAYAGKPVPELHSISRALVLNSTGMAQGMQEEAARNKTFQKRIENDWMENQSTWYGGRAVQKPTEQQVQEFAQGYAKAHGGEVLPEDRTQWEALPEWQDFRRKVLVANGGKLPTDAAIKKDLDARVAEDLYQRTLGVARRVGVGGAPQAAPAQPSGPTPVPANVSPSFVQKTEAVAQRLGMKPADLIQIMNFETGGTFSTATRNGSSGATGLIQFLPSTSEEMGTTTAALAKMTPEQQLDYVEQYFTPYKGRVNTLQDAYMAVLSPKAIGQPPETVLFRQGTDAYRQNAALDKGKKGYVTVADAVGAVQDYARRTGLGGAPASLGEAGATPPGAATGVLGATRRLPGGRLAYTPYSAPAVVNLPGGRTGYAPPIGP